MINHIAVISDLHSGCRLGLCPNHKVRVDGGGFYYPSDAQLWIWSKWLEYWKWVDLYSKKTPFAVVLNGDEIDGVHHGSTTQISHNLSDQANIAYEILSPIVDRCQGNFYVVRGTAAHVGECAEETEKLARRLGAKQIGNDASSTYELRLLFGEDKYLNAMHTIGGGGSIRSKASAPMAELAEIWANIGRWGGRLPDVIVRAHRHEYIKVEMASYRGDQFIYVNPAWQLKTPYGKVISGARTSTPQIGGTLITYSPKKQKLWVDKYVESIQPEQEEYILCNLANGKKL